MEAFLWLIVMSAAMFFGSMISGIIPLRLNISERKMKLCTIFGAGLLLGTAFSVIIPEGIETLYSAQEGVNAPISPGSGGAGYNKQIVPINTEKEHDHSHADEPGKERRSIDSPQPVVDSPKRKKRHAHGGHGHGHSVCDELRTPNINAKMGFSLIFGFLFMLFVDQISSWFTARGERAERGRLGLSATIGLVVHAAADGIAMGSAAFSSEESLKFIVFFAIILHKMPASFGLVSFLISNKLPERKLYKYLGVFSSSAPVAALATYFFVNRLSFLSSQSSIACLMLFSAGTFLYVATIHVFPELVNKSDDDSRADTDMEAMIVDVQQPSLAGGHSHQVPSFTSTELLFMITGAVIPGFSMLLIH